MSLYNVILARCDRTPLLSFWLAWPLQQFLCQLSLAHSVPLSAHWLDSRQLRRQVASRVVSPGGSRSHPVRRSTGSPEQQSRPRRIVLAASSMCSAGQHEHLGPRYVAPSRASSDDSASPLQAPRAVSGMFLSSRPSANEHNNCRSCIGNQSSTVSTNFVQERSKLVSTKPKRS
jgi:hypothetical protein